MTIEEIAKKYGGQVSIEDIASKYGGISDTQNTEQKQPMGNDLLTMPIYGTDNTKIKTGVDTSTTMMNTLETPVENVNPFDVIINTASQMANGIMPVWNDVFNKVGSFGTKLGTDFGYSLSTNSLRQKLDDPNTLDSDKLIIAKRLTEKANNYAEVMTRADAENPSWTKIGADSVSSIANVASMLYGPGWLKALYGGLTLGGGSVVSKEIKKLGGENDQTQGEIIGGGIIDTILGTFLNKFLTPGENKGILARSLITKGKVAEVLEQTAKETNAELTELLPSFKTKIEKKTSDLITSLQPQIEERTSKLVESGIIETQAKKQATEEIIKEAQTQAASEFSSETFKTGKADLISVAEDIFNKNKQNTLDLVHGNLLKKLDAEQIQTSIERRVGEVTDNAWKVKDQKYGSVFGDKTTKVDTKPIVDKLTTIIDDLGKSAELSDESAKLIEKYSELKRKLISSSGGVEEFTTGQIGRGTKAMTVKVKNPNYNPTESSFSINDIDKSLAIMWKDKGGIVNKFDKSILRSFKDAIEKSISNDPVKVNALKDAMDFFEKDLAERSKGYLNIWKEVDGMNQLDDALTFFAKNKVTLPQVERFYKEIGEDLTNNFQESMVNKILESAKTVDKNGELVIDPVKLESMVKAFRTRNLVSAKQASTLLGYQSLSKTTFEDWLKTNDRSEWANLMKETLPNGKATAESLKTSEESIAKIKLLNKTKLDTSDPSLFVSDLSKIESKEQLNATLDLFKGDEKDALSKLLIENIKANNSKMIGNDPILAVNGIIKDVNNLSTNFRKLFNTKQLKLFETLIKETSDIQNAKNLTKQKIEGILHLFMGTMQAGRAYPGAITSFKEGLSNILSGSTLYKDTANKMITEGTAYDETWKMVVSKARDILRSEKLKTLIPLIPSNQTSDFTE